MKKPGEWIAALTADLAVSQIVVDANPVLDWIEVTELDRDTGRPAAVRFLDRAEGARLMARLGEALEELDPPLPRYAAVFASSAAGRVWTVEDQHQHELVAPTWRGAWSEKCAEDWAAHLNAQDRATDHPPPSAPGP